MRDDDDDNDDDNVLKMFDINKGYLKIYVFVETIELPGSGGVGVGVQLGTRKGVGENRGVRVGRGG